MEAMVVTVALFMAARVIKERMEVTVVMAGMVEAGTMVVMAAVGEMVEMVVMAEKEETLMVDLRALL